MLPDSISWTSSGVTDRGKIRTVNEDAFLDVPEAGVWAVADGMGGHDAGDYASAMIISSLSVLVPSADLSASVEILSNRLKAVNLELIKESRDRALSMIGSTVVVMLVRNDKFVCLWAGDSRLYRLRQGVLKQISRDHSEVQELVDRGVISNKDAEKHSSANIITRAVGAFERLELDQVTGQLEPGDKFLLCSDGLYKEVSDREVAESMQFDGEPARIAHNLLQLALARGARDNTTVISINFDGC